VHGEGGQATVEWVALVLAAALVLGATAALTGREDDRGLGDALAKRIASGPSALDRRGAAPESGAGAAPPASAAAPPASAAAPPASAAAPPPARTAEAVQAFRRLRGIEDIARHTWIVCLGYKRWRYELENPMAPNEALPLGDALDIVNGCLNPYDYLLED
jgi:hypothetical protein